MSKEEVSADVEADHLEEDESGVVSNPLQTREPALHARRRP